MRLEAMPIASAKIPDHAAPVARTSSSDAPAARDLLIRRIARLSFLIDLEASEIMIRNERRLVDEALNALIAVSPASINDLPIAESDRPFHWPLGLQPEGHPGLSQLGV